MASNVLDFIPKQWITTIARVIKSAPTKCLLLLGVGQFWRDWSWFDDNTTCSWEMTNPFGLVQRIYLLEETGHFDIVILIRRKFNSSKVVCSQILVATVDQWVLCTLCWVFFVPSSLFWKYALYFDYPLKISTQKKQKRKSSIRYSIEYHNNNGAVCSRIDHSE